MPGLKIRNGAGTEIGTTSRAALGAKCEWTVTGTGGEKAHDVRWTFSGPAHVVANYAAAKARATVTPFDAGSQTDRGTWYWARRGRVTITLKARVGVTTHERTVYVDVDGPEVDWFGSETDQVKVARIDAHVPGVFLTFGGELGSRRPGIRITARVRGPGTPGEFAFTQLMTIHRSRVYALNGVLQAPVVATSNDVYVLDEVVHYPIDLPDGGMGERDTAPSAMREEVELVSDDSPSTPLGQERHRPERIYMESEVDEQFRTYLMWKPTGGIWISVALLEWFWKGKAVYTAATHTWSLESGDEPLNPVGKKGVAFPTWTQNRDDILRD